MPQKILHVMFMQIKMKNESVIWPVSKKYLLIFVAYLKTVSKYGIS